MSNNATVAPLHDAVEACNVEAVKALLKKKHNVNAVDYRGWTPLHCASRLFYALVCLWACFVDGAVRAFSPSSLFPHYCPP